MAEREVAKSPEANQETSQPRTGESARTQVYGNPGDQATLQAFRGLRSGDPQADFSVPNLELHGSLTAQTIPGQTTDASTRQLGQPGTPTPGADPERRGTAVIDTTYAGASRTGGSAFPVNLDGIATTPRDGQRLFATNAHVVSDILSGTPDAHYKFGGNLFTESAVLSKEQLLAKGQSIISDVQTGQIPPPENTPVDRAVDNYSRQLGYMSEHFNEIKALSGGANGITQAGLDKYRAQGEHSYAITEAGIIPVRTVAKDVGTDIAVLQACGLTPQQQEMLGPDRKLADRDPQSGDNVVFRGYPRGQFSKVDSYVFGQLPPREKYRETVPTTKTWPGTDHGGSGSEVDLVRDPRKPEALSAKTEVLGIAHETDDSSGSPKEGHIMPVSVLRNMLDRIRSGEIPLRRCP